eukprot:3845873-Prymnesium_polylepis.1
MAQVGGTQQELSRYEARWRGHSGGRGFRRSLSSARSLTDASRTCASSQKPLTGMLPKRRQGPCGCCHSKNETRVLSVIPRNARGPTKKWRPAEACCTGSCCSATSGPFVSLHSPHVAAHAEC